MWGAKLRPGRFDAVFTDGSRRSFAAPKKAALQEWLKVRVTLIV